jgi:hypothetical protein
MIGMNAVKDEAAKLVAALPDDATWDDLMYEIYVRQAIDAGIQDSESGNVSPIDDVRREFGLR